MHSTTVIPRLAGLQRTRSSLAQNSSVAGAAKQFAPNSSVWTSARKARACLYLTMSLACLLPGMTPAMALASGAVLALLVPHPSPRLARRVCSWLLQGCVVLLGFSMNLSEVMRVGERGALLAAITIAVTLLTGWWLGRALRLRGTTALLISAGTAICGGSAIAAVGSIIDADEGDMTVAMGAIFLFNAVALYLFPLIGRQLRLTSEQFGAWAGVAIHDVSSVVGAAGRFGGGALQIATAVKLSRALWIVPLTLALSASRRAGAGLSGTTFGFDAGAQKTPTKLQIPWFILLFVLASVSRSMFPAVAGVSATLAHAATLGLTLALFLVGAGFSRITLMAVGPRALVHAFALWALISVGSIVLILHGHG